MLIPAPARKPARSIGSKPFEVVAERPRRPQIAPVEREEPAPAQPDVDAAEDLRAWRPPLGLEDVGEYGLPRIEGVDEVAGLLESIPEHSAAGAGVGDDRTRHPREPADLAAARYEREPDVAGQIQLRERGGLFDRLAVVVDEVRDTPTGRTPG